MSLPASCLAARAALTKRKAIGVDSNIARAKAQDLASAGHDIEAGMGGVDLRPAETRARGCVHGALVGQRREAQHAGFIRGALEALLFQLSRGHGRVWPFRRQAVLPQRQVGPQHMDQPDRRVGVRARRPALGGFRRQTSPLLSTTRLHHIVDPKTWCEVAFAKRQTRMHESSNADGTHHGVARQSDHSFCCRAWGTLALMGPSGISQREPSKVFSPGA